MLSGTANGITTVVLPWLVLDRTGSAAAAGVVAAATALPLLVTSLLAGTLVDRIGRRRASIVADVASGVAIAAIPLLDLAGALGLAPLVVLAAAGAIIDPAGITARESMLPEAAEAAGVRLDRVNGVHEAAWGLSFIVGPGVGGVLIGLVGPESTLWATATAFALSVLVMSAIRVPGAERRPRRPVGTRGPSFLGETLDGVLFVWRDRLVLSVAVLSTLLVGTYLPIEGVLLPVRLGLLLLVMSVGWVVGSLLYGVLAHRLPRRRTFQVSMLGTALALVPMAFVPPYPILLLSGALAGMLYGPLNPLTNLVLQRRTPPAMRGRVIGVVTSLGYAAGPVGYLVAGQLVERLGLGAAFALVVSAVVATALLAPFLRVLRGLDELDLTVADAPSAGSQPADRLG